jgi:hypothetical protein
MGSNITKNIVGNYIVRSFAEINDENGIDWAWLETNSSDKWQMRVENTPNSGFENVTRVSSKDSYKDVNRNRPLPWGAEIWEGNPTFLVDKLIKRTGKYSSKLSGTSPDDVIVLAIPDYPTEPNEIGKPDINVGEIYRLEAWVKLVNVSGNGVRLMQQFFNSTFTYLPEYSFYGPFYKGTSDWFKISFDAKTVDPDNILGDPVVELWGSGGVWIDDLRFYSLQSASPKDMKSRKTYEFTPSLSIYNNIYDFTDATKGFDGNFVWMGPNSFINVTSWDNSIPADANLKGVNAYVGIDVSYGGILTFWTNYTGDINSCKFDTNGITSQNFTCDLKAAGIDTINKVNNLQLAVKFDSNGNANLDWIHITVDDNPISPKNVWTMANFTWYPGNSLPQSRICYNNTIGNIFCT